MGRHSIPDEPIPFEAMTDDEFDSFLAELHRSKQESKLPLGEQLRKLAERDPEVHDADIRLTNAIKRYVGKTHEEDDGTGTTGRNRET